MHPVVVNYIICATTKLHINLMYNHKILQVFKTLNTKVTD